MGGGASVSADNPNDYCDENKNWGSPKRFNLGTIQLVVGDLVNEKVDAIVLGKSSKKLIEKLVLKAGSNVKQQYDSITSAPIYSPSFSLPGGNLHCKKIFIIKWWQPANDSKALTSDIRAFVKEAVKLGLSENYSSLSMPIIGFGPNKYRTSLVVKTFMSAIRWELNHATISLNFRILILPGKDALCYTIERQLGGWSRYDMEPESTRPIPKTWVPTQPQQMRVTVSSGTEEYKTTLQLFNNTMAGKYGNVISIERIQNKKWYLQYMSHYNEFKDRLQKDTEQRLFHGSSEDSANEIIKTYFNRSFAGVHGVSYGSGVYFSSQASYSNSYASPNAQNERHMFIARVLVGNTIVGKPQMKIPPAGYDSTTDGKHIFVTYYDTQAYPEYLIKYK